MEKVNIATKKGKMIRGTAVFVALTPREIVVAADSQQVDENDKPTPEEVCKIRKFASGYIVMNGYVGSDDSEYSFFKILKESVDENLSLAENVLRLEAAIIPSLTKAVNKVKAEDEDSFRRNLVEQPPLGFCAFGMENNSPVFYAKKFFVVDSSADEVSIEVKGDECPRDGHQKGLYLVGSPEIDVKLIEKYPLLLGKGMLRLTLTAVAREYMKNLIDAGIPKIGGPIDMMRVSANGVNWIQKKDSCKDE